MAQSRTITTTTVKADVILKPENIKNVEAEGYPQKAKSLRLFGKKLSELKWFNITMITFLHAMFFRELIRYQWLQNLDIIFFTIIQGIFIANGITAGVHRLWTHRSYKAKLPLRIFWMLCYSFSGISPMCDWIKDHRVHHKYVDTDADPYNAKRGFFFSHVGWLFVKKHPEVIKKGKQIDMSDVLADPVIQFHQKYFVILFVLGFIIPFIIPPLCFGKSWYVSFLTTIIARYTIELNVIWSINSVAHKWGIKPYNKDTSPTDSYSFARFTWGEGWHDYHHAFPWSYRFGKDSGYDTDGARFWIDMFAKIGWAYDLKTPSDELIRKVAERRGNTSHVTWEEVEITEDIK